MNITRGLQIFLQVVEVFLLPLTYFDTKYQIKLEINALELVIS